MPDIKFSLVIKQRFINVHLNNKRFGGICIFIFVMLVHSFFNRLFHDVV
jgi:hypothetical protein